LEIIKECLFYDSIYFLNILELKTKRVLENKKLPRFASYSKILIL